ncbi:MAG: NAD(P) transhydrogenase subunit alpha [Deltaproteobacteria bacterium]|nr:MAG: NAD(P) transhydrogenase subunit alpha [Deltaproteobacteria bacterium]
MLRLGVIGTSNKENERRIPIHPDHLLRLPEQLRRQLIFEQGYGASLGISDTEIAEQTGGTASRRELLADVGAVVLAKPTLKDLKTLREGGILWGWPHVVQQTTLTQVAIDRKQTLIAFEEMYVWGPDGHAGRHTFYKNNELAGYCAVLHALQLRGIDGHYGNQRKTIIISFGAVSKGAIYALKARGFRDITICIQRPDHMVREEVLGCHYVRIRQGEKDQARLVAVEHDGAERPFIDLLSEADIIVNGIYQNPDNPLMFVAADEIPRLKRDCLIVDVSCDEAMGFPFAKPTTFDEPMFKVGTVDYYAVDHTPSYLWESASRSISAALIVHLPTVMAGRGSWHDDETIRRAVVIDEGVIKKAEVFSFQQRQVQYPHEPIVAGG